MAVPAAVRLNAPALLLQRLQGVAEVDLSSQVAAAASSACSPADWRARACRVFLNFTSSAGVTGSLAGMATVLAGAKAELEEPASLERLQVARAVALGDASSISGNAIRRALNSTIARVNSTTISMLQEIYGEGAQTPMTFIPNRYSMLFRLQDSEFAAPLIVSNTQDASDSPRDLAVAGVSHAGTGGRFAAFAANPFSNRDGGRDDPAFQAFLVRTLTWLNKGIHPNVTGSAYRVVLAHMADNDLAPDDVRTPQYFSANFPRAWYNAEDACENAALATCLKNASVLIISTQSTRHDDGDAPSSTADEPAIAATVADFLRRGGSVIYFHYYSAAFPLTAPLLATMGLEFAGGNDGTYLDRGTIDLVLPTGGTSSSKSSKLASYQQLLQTMSGSPLTVADFPGGRGIPCDGSSSWHGCSDVGFDARFRLATLDLRSSLETAVQNGVNLFASAGSSILKLFVLLADKYRQEKPDAGTLPIRLPFRHLDMANWTSIAFADALGG